MGRFKIYDPEKLVNILNDSSYAECLLCGKQLKNIMGNIKRHYEQMHSVFVDANVKEKKSRKKSLKFAENDKDYKVNMKAKNSINIKNQNTPTIKKEYKSNATDPQKLVLTTISSNSKNNLDSAPMPSVSLFTENIKLSSGGSKRESYSNEFKVNNNKPPIRKTTSKKEQQVKSITLSFEAQESIQGENKTKIVSIDKLVQPLPHSNSNIKKFKLNEENDGIEIPCYSYINSIQVSSLDSCYPVEFLNCIVETKAQVNIPLKCFQKGETFQKALQSWEQTFNFNYNSQTIGEHIDRMAKKLRQEIIKMVADRIIYLKLDIASSKDSNVMLVNIQFFNDFEIKVVTLSALELAEDDLAKNLKEKVLTILKRYKIDIDRVYSITKDNTKNVREPLTHNKINFIQEERDGTGVCPQDIDFCQHLCEKFPGHAIHFVACDIIKQLNENISQSRDSVKIIRRQFSQHDIQQRPLLDNANSWFSVYDMINSLINVREVIESNSHLMVEVDWLFAIKFVESFRPIVDTALMLQKNHLFVMGDFYREWLLCEIELEELTENNELAFYVLKALRKRTIDFFDNASFLAALYLDPRFCYMGSMYFNDKQKEIAITQLLQIFNKMKTITSSKNTGLNFNNRYSKLEKLTVGSLKTNMEMMTTSLNNVDCQWVKESLEQLQFDERLSVNTNILDYWKMNKYKSPILAKIAEIALAAPATQATINRALNASSISIMKDKLNESPDVIESILLLKLNQDIVDKITLE